MLFASNRGAGGALGFPDICMIPMVPSPIPGAFVNVSMNAQAVPFALTVHISMMNGLNLIAQVPITMGDEPGSASPIKGPQRYTMGNPVVYVEAMPGVNQLCPTTGNNMVNPLGASVIPSIVNVFFTLQAGEGPADRPDVTAPEVERLCEVMSAPEPVTPGVTLERAIGHVGVALFTLETPTLLHTEIEKLKRSGMDALVLDLRGCPGGDLEACLRLADDFLERGDVIVRMVEGDGDETEIRARQGDPYRFPLFLLVDHGTASAAELFAGSLQARGRAVVIGETTCGKGSAQRLLPGSGEPGAHYLTVATFTLPDGQPIDGRGVRPDLEVAPELALQAALVAARSALIDPNETTLEVH
jgi:carboxyl-terminal processing protease